jgi:DNA-binding transcriptional MerR regulator/methylmalonyl-CoA mutase cobalamin-binding subunit
LICWASTLNKRGTIDGVSTQQVFRIRQAASRAGISPATVRMWEKRYGLLRPDRTAGGYRLYSAEDVEVLRGAAALVATGQSIGEVAHRPLHDLRDAAKSVQTDASAPMRERRAVEQSYDSVIEAALAAAKELDREGFEAALLPVLALAALDPVDACDRVLLPLLRKIGVEWQAGRLDIAAEHFASSIIRAKLLHYLDFLPRPASGPLVVCACPGDERHELGLLAFAVHAASSGWRVLLLGAGTPFAEAVSAASRRHADLLAVALTMDLSAEEHRRMAGVLAKARAARPLRVLAGGPAADRDAEFLAGIGVEVARSFRTDLAKGQVGG